MGSIGNELRRVVPGGVKGALAGLLCHPVVGAGLAKIFDDRIPSRGMRVHTDDPRVANETKAARLRLAGSAHALARRISRYQSTVLARPASKSTMGW